MTYITLFFKTELTCIPRILSKWLGDYYNNCLCNGSTWIFVLWWILHVGFYKSLNALFKRLRFKQYERDRLIDILWYLGFYGTGLVYCGAALSQNEVELFNFKKMHVPSNTSLPMQVVLGYTLILMFYLHSAFWEGLTQGRVINMLSYLFLFLFMLSSYILRVVEISFTLCALISISQVNLHITRGFLVVLDQRSLHVKLFIAVLFIVTLAVNVVINLIVIPLTFIVPLGLKILTDYPNILLWFLFFNLFAWLVADLYQSILFKFVNHWIYHGEEFKRKSSISSSDGYEPLEKPKICSRTLFECSLFLPRNDLTYEIQQIRKEIEERKNKMMALRKPKNMFVQTLKYMLTINKKIKQRRRRSADDSESSENTEDFPENVLASSGMPNEESEDDEICGIDDNNGGGMDDDAAEEIDVYDDGSELEKMDGNLKEINYH